MVVGKKRQFDFRVICPCQLHAKRNRVRRIASIAARAVIVGGLLAFGALGIPTEAMNVRLPQLTETMASSSFHIFTTPKVRDQFLLPEKPKQEFTLDLVKEDFFRREIPYGSIIFREARRNDLLPELVAAVIESESDFRPRLVSEKQAQGLMQIVPETGRLFGCDNPFNPTENIAAGTRYLRYLLDRFGDQRTALAAYNAGEGNVEKFGGIPPFAETTNYLQRVAYRTHSYRQRIHNRYLSAVRMRGALTE